MTGKENPTDPPEGKGEAPASLRPGDALPSAVRIDVVGTDASGVEGLPRRCHELLRQADLVAAPRRLHKELETWRSTHGVAWELLRSDPLPALIDRLRHCLVDRRRVVILASGDPLWFGIGRQLLAQLPAGSLRFHPGATSLQLAFARIGRPWQDASWISLHGRDPEPLAARLQQRPSALAVLTDPMRGGAETVLRLLVASGLRQAYRFWLCERLGHPHERVRALAPGEPVPTDLDPLHLVVLIAEPAPPPDPGTLPLFGIEDGVWLQHPDRPGLMTKREVRVQVLAELELPSLGVLWDIGAGVGSIGLEALRLRPALQLWALERRGGGAALIRANAERVGVRPTAVLEGEAPEALEHFPDPDRVVIGGGGRERGEILAAVLRRLRPGGVVVIPLATMEAMAELRPALQTACDHTSIHQLQIWRGAALADGTRLAPLNPVLLLKGRRN